MFKRKKWSALSLVIGCMMILAACSGGDSGSSEASSDITVNTDGFPIVDEPIEMTMFGPNHGLAEWEDMHFSKRWKK
ncbi:hypothetical protein G4V62_02755 [Bacillaceae bacterium SIJ1]|uniref:hypothetical protein n=1 Tax=Litoribacterium kuwaitense TaxID=1398745 RepID=UPI0013EAD21B|nr:hypothetical protein [Litoribacterium kuwaitense]NGP43920.1 hypothetical protein [Litoribacterium kuwaitense]